MYTFVEKMHKGLIVVAFLRF